MPLILAMLRGWVDLALIVAGLWFAGNFLGMWEAFLMVLAYIGLVIADEYNRYYLDYEDEDDDNDEANWGV